VHDLKGKTAVVTGGASGIGLAMAEAFGAEGMKLVLADIEQPALDRALPALRAKGYEAMGVRCDVARYEEVEALARATLDAFGAAHVVVNNAGVSMTGPIWQLSLDDWRWVWDVNVWGVVHGIRAFAPLLVAQGEGHIVNTASEAGFLGIGYHAPYCASKWAVVAMSLSLRSELEAACSGVGCSVVCPGFVDTQIHRSWRNRPEGDRPWSERHRADPAAIAGADAFQARGVRPEEIARVTLEAVKADRFWVFNTPHWREMIGRVKDQILSGENPPVNTWGPDLRPDAGPSRDPIEP
jgi:NAD(P)-dependent dehydrogenase (short-subunit alcohol dehydrogenase family)